MGEVKPNSKPKFKAKREPYRKIQVKMWQDPQFMALSPLPPSGQSLLIYLLTGPFTSNIPGLFKAGRAAMAEELAWEQKAFDEALNEALTLGLVKTDPLARLVWIPGAINFNMPESVNVIKSWRNYFDLLPECPLKHEAWQALQTACHGLSEAYGKAFDMTIYEPAIKAGAKSCVIQKSSRTIEQLNNKNFLSDNKKPPAVQMRHDTSSQSAFIMLPLNDGEDFPVQESMVSEWERLYPGINVRQELRNQRGWLIANPKNLKTKSGINRFIVNWLTKSQNKTLRISESNNFDENFNIDNAIPPGFRG